MMKSEDVGGSSGAECKMMRPGVVQGIARAEARVSSCFHISFKQSLDRGEDGERLSKADGSHSETVDCRPYVGNLKF